MRLSEQRRVAAEDDFAAGFAKALDYVQRRVVERVRSAATTLIASAEDDQVAAWGALPLATAAASLDPAAAYDPAWWRKGYMRYVAKRVDGFYSSTVDRAGAELGVDFDPEDPAIADALDGLDDTADLWGGGLADFVAGQVRAGMAEGDTVSGLAARLRDSEDSWFGLARAALLASVAVATTYNRATLAAGTSARAQGTSSTKEWVTQGDDRVRPDHEDMDGVTIDIGEDFLVAGAYPAAGPHDERLPVELVANCRCVLSISGDGGSVADESTDVQDDGAAPLDYATDGSEEDALVAGPSVQYRRNDRGLIGGVNDVGTPGLSLAEARDRLAALHTHGHCERCGGWLEGRSYCGKCGRGYTGPLLDAGAAPADADLSHDRPSQADTMPINGEDVGLVAADGVDQENRDPMTTTAPVTGTPTIVAASPSSMSTEELVQRFQAADRAGQFADIGMQPWRGVLAIEGRPTGDGRMFRQGALYWDKGFLPTDLFAMLADPDGGMGHDGSAICGRIDRMWKQPAEDGSYSEVWGEGVYDTGSATGAEVFRLQQNGMLTGVSIDVDSVEVVMPDVTDDNLLEILFGGGVEEYSSGRIRRATVCSIPAFIEARIFPVSDTGALVASAASEECRELRVWTPLELAKPADGGLGSLVASAAAFPAKPKAKEADVFHSSLVDEGAPAAVFARQEYRQYTPYEVDQFGRVSGHVTPWGECHIGFTDRCVTAPRSRTGYLHARTGRTLTVEGDIVATARVFAQFGHGRAHAPEELAAAPTVEWYESQALAVADVAIFEDAHGIQIQGRVRPGATRAQVVALRCSRISPDWRSINGSLECVGLAVVNVSGFTNSSRLPALVASAMAAGEQVTLPDPDELHGAAFLADGEVLTLVASGGPTRDLATMLVGVVQKMAERLEALEQAELARQAAALVAGLPSEAEEQAALAAQMSTILDGVDLDVEAAAVEAAATSEETVTLTVAELATLRAAAAIAGRLALAAGDPATVTCPNCGATMDAGLDNCPNCGMDMDDDDTIGVDITIDIDVPTPDAEDMNPAAAAGATRRLAAPKNPPPPPKKKPAPVVGTITCPNCGETVPADAAGGDCPECGQPIPAAAADMAASSAALSQVPDRRCAECGARMAMDQDACPNCGAAYDPSQHAAAASCTCEGSCACSAAALASA